MGEVIPQDRAGILEEIGEIARREVGYRGPLEGRDRIVEDLGLDSLQRLTLAVAVEDRFLVCLEEADEEEIETVDDLVAAVAGKLGDPE